MKAKLTSNQIRTMEIDEIENLAKIEMARHALQTLCEGDGYTVSRDLWIEVFEGVDKMYEKVQETVNEIKMRGVHTDAKQNVR